MVQQHIESMFDSVKAWVEMMKPVSWALEHIAAGARGPGATPLTAEQTWRLGMENLGGVLLVTEESVEVQPCAEEAWLRGIKARGLLLLPAAAAAAAAPCCSLLLLLGS